jgi:putative FmdB family regulatory protein
MPIYEFYCADCHTVFNFFSRSVNTTKRPACPRCNRPKLERRVSRFAISKNRVEPGEGKEAGPDIDDEKLERVMDELARETEGVNEDDPRQMARMMRKLFGSTGMPIGERMEEALRRMEAGEDPDRVEEEMGDFMDEEESLFGEAGEAGGRLRGLARKLKPPAVDETLYDL